jgi:hypothetical protein
VQRKIFVNATQAGDEVIFERSNGTFGSVATMNARWGKLEVNFFLAHELFEWFSAFVVEAL